MGSEIYVILKDAFENAFEVITRAIAFIKKFLAFFKGAPEEETAENT